MDDQTFADFLSTWLDPYELLTAAERFDHDRDRALAPAVLLITSGRITDGDEAHFATMVERYVRGFRIPSALIDFVRGTAGSAAASAEAWDWLLGLSMSARVDTYSHGNTPPGTSPMTIIGIHERDAVTDIIKRPIMALLEIVRTFALNWREWAATRASIYYKHNMPDSFYAYVDYQVASFYLELVNPETFASGSLKTRYRAVTLAGLTDDDRHWEIAQKTARDMAASTFDPIGEMGR
jgi:hypothetical protein